MKSLFRGHTFSYTEEAERLYKEIYSCIKPIMLEYLKHGYSLREISHLMHIAISDLEAIKSLSLLVESRKKKEDNHVY